MKMGVFFASKGFSIIVSIVLSITLNGTMSMMYMLVTIFLLLEVMISLQIERMIIRRYSLAFISSVFLILGMISLGRQSLNYDVFFGLLYISIFIYSYFLLFIEYNYDMETKLSLQTKLFREAAKTNEDLRHSQNKFKLIHEEMAEQKYELEVANKRLNKMTAEIYTQNELLRYISQVLDIRELIDLVTDAIMGTIGVDTCSLVLYDDRNSKYLFSVKSNHPGNHREKLIEDVHSGCLQSYFQTGKIHLNNRVIPENYPFIGNRPVGSIAIIPLLRNDLTYGVLIAEHRNIDIFTENNVQFFQGIATQITIAINNANLYALMENMAVKDGLTDIYNRKYLQDHIHELVSKANQESSDLSVALFDIDHFKSVNDKYGHLFGDEAIKMAAKVTQKIAVRHNGLAIRYGGEEFVLVLPKKDLMEAYEIVKQLHDEITHQMLRYEDKEVYINISIGISSYPDVASHGEELLLRADNAMYYSKQHGRGKITLDSKGLEKVF